MGTALLLEAELKMSQDHEVILADHREQEPGIVTGLHGRRHGSRGPAPREGASDEIRNVIYTIIMTKVTNLHVKILLSCVSSGICHKLLFIVPGKFGMSEGI